MSVKPQETVLTSQRRWRLWWVIALSVSSVALALPAGATTLASKFVIHGNSDRAGLAFYKGKTINFVSLGTAGSNNDIETRIEASYIATYLKATVDVVDIAGANGIQAGDAVAAAAANGLTIGNLSPLADASSTITDTPGLNFNPERVAFLGGTQGLVNVLVESANQPDPSFAALKNAKTPTKVLIEAGSTGTRTEALVTAFGLKVDYVSGYTNQPGIITGLLRGDGPVTLITLSAIGPNLVAGQVKAIATTGIPPVGSEYRSYATGVPTFAKLEKQYPAKGKNQKELYGALLGITRMVGTAFFTQTKVPSDKVNALRDAFDWAFKQAGLKSALLQSGNNPQFVNGAAVKASYIYALSLGKYLRPILTITL